jgi:hypothetical protein
MPVNAADVLGLLIVNVSDVVVPTAMLAAPNAILSVGEDVVVTVAVDGGEVTGGPDGGVPEDVAESFTEPLLRSA